MFKALLRIRLSYYFVIFLVFYTGLLMVIPKPELPGAGLTLFSINSFLFGFYFTPILNNQKGRIEELGKIIRMESVSLFKILVKTRKITNEKDHDKIQSLIADYIKAKLRDKKAKGIWNPFESLLNSDFKNLENKDDQA